MAMALPASPHIHIMGHSADSTELVEDALTWSAPQEYPESGSPNFVWSGANGKFFIGIGGKIQATASFDWGDPIDSDNAFSTSQINMSPEPGDGARWQFGARNSMFFVNFVAMPGDPDMVGGYINFNFCGDGYAPQLQYAYLKWRCLTAGYSYSLFTDMDASTPSIDYQGPNSFTGVQMPLINAEGFFGNDHLFRWGVGATLPIASMTDGNGARQVSQRLPDVPAYLQVNWDDCESHVRVSALLRNLYYRDLVASCNVDKLGWGVKLSGVATIAGSLTGYFQALYGKGVSSYYQDLTDAGMDMCYGADGVMNPVESWGAYAGLQYEFSDRLRLSGAYSHIRLYRNAGETMPECDASYRYAQYAVGTLLYDVTSWFGCGVEYIYGRRVNFDGTQRHDNRIQTSLELRF